MKTVKQLLAVLTFLIVPFVVFSQNEIDLLLLNKNYDEALLQINRELAQNPSADLLTKKGWVYNSLQDYQNALAAFSEALQLKPNDAQLLTEIAETLSLLGNGVDAEHFFKSAVELDPGNLPLKAKLGRVYINQKKLKQAYGIFSEIFALDSTNVYWNKQLAYCAFQVGKRQQAVHLYETVLEANPRDFATYANLVHSYNRRNEADKILAVLDKGQNEFPGNPELILERANFYFKERKHKQAMPEFENYFAAKGDSIYEIVMNYAISIYFADDEAKAMKVLGRLFGANPNDPFVQFYMSLCYKKMNNYPEAEKYMQWAIDASHPDYLSDMYHHLGQIFGQQRKFKESIRALQKSNELNPDNVEVLFEIATTYEEFNSNKTLAMNYYRLYLKEAGEEGENVNYALNRISRIKEELFFEE